MMEMMQENDCRKVPEVYMKMSDVELEKEKQKLLRKSSHSRNGSHCLKKEV